MWLLKLLFLGSRKISRKIESVVVAVYILSLKGFKNVRIGNTVQFRGKPIINVSKNALLTIGEGCIFNSGFSYNLIGRQQPCIFNVLENGVLRIGNNVGMSSVAIIVGQSVEIEDSVMIGGNTVIYDTDFHQLGANQRVLDKEEQSKVGKANVIVRRGAFIGANTTILKGVEIGEFAVIGACSVVIKSIPPGEVWAGNPARFIRKIQ